MGIQIFGIRHHGPGSARRLLQALDAMQPDVLLVEAPADAEKLLSSIQEEDLIPPVAMLLYDKNDLSNASYYPFASFSPEWQAIRWALGQGIAVQFMDLPQGIHFGRKLEKAEQKQLVIDPSSETLTKDDRQLARDPMGYLSKLAGYEDSERWWEVTFEEQFDNHEIFPALLELITALRNEQEVRVSPETLLREAFMRKTMRDAIKKGADNMAVVCGAWHAPALADLKQYKQADDNRLLRGLKKIKVDATWIPWTYERLAFQSGYGAGVTAPAWYHLLFDNPEDAVVRWMGNVAKLFREKDMAASSAHIIEAVRLAETLATVRQLKIPGIAEMREAAVSILCNGDAEQLAMIEKQLHIGNGMGQVPASIPKIPLQADLEKRIKSCRLGKIWRDGSDDSKELDLRVPNQLAISQLLHQMNVLHIPWGKRQTVGKGSSAGAFSEKWTLEWQPELMLQIIEAGMWGNTVINAATNKIANQINDIEDLPTLTSLIESAFNANLVAVIEPLIVKISAASVDTRDVTQLMDALTPLINATRYGSTRGLDVDKLAQLIRQLVPRICVALPANCIHIDEEATAQMFKRINTVNRGIFIFNEKDLTERWLDALAQLSDTKQTSALLRGATTRILFDKEILPIEEVGNRMHYSLSPAFEKEQSAAWLEGFCYGSGLLIIHNLRLWNIINEWVVAIPFEAFRELLPLLRRTFAEFSEPERRKMMALAKRGQVKEREMGTALEVGYDVERGKRVLPVVQLLLGES